MTKHLENTEPSNSIKPVLCNGLKPTDLRIGNKIFFIMCDSECSKLDEKKEITVDISDFEFIRDNNSLFEGIPLTENILLKLGFRHVMNNWFNVFANGNTFNVYIFESGKYRVEIVSQSLGTFKYVHELQNLYFALTGSELTVA